MAKQYYVSNYFLRNASDVSHKTKHDFLSQTSKIFEHVYMFLIKLNTIFFHKPPETLNMYIFSSTNRHFWFKCFFSVWEKYWHESTLQRNLKNNKIKMLFTTEKQNWNLNCLERLYFQPCFFVLFSDLALSSLLTLLEQKSTRGKKYTHNYKKQLD